MDHATTTPPSPPTFAPAARLRRREFMLGAAGLGLSVAGSALLAGCGSGSLPLGPAPREPRLETTSIRLIDIPGICVAPQWLAEEFLASEGFTDVQYLKKGRLEANRALASGEAQMDVAFGGSLVTQIEAGDPIVLLGGVHAGCFELFGADQRVRSIRDLQGKTVGVTQLGSGRHIFLMSMLAYVGLDPHRDVQFVTQPPAEAMQLLAEGKIDAFMAFPPEPQELRAKKIGHVVLSTTADRPWSDYICCMVVANREWVRQHPVATKRALRAVLKASDLCTSEPERAARFLVDRGYASQYDYALMTMQELPYRRWHEYDPEDAVRFYALRLHDVGVVKSSPERIIAQGTDWRFFNELKRELKG